jgi:hypothetical protein
MKKQAIPSGKLNILRNQPPIGSGMENSFRSTILIENMDSAVITNMSSVCDT